MMLNRLALIVLLAFPFVASAADGATTSSTTPQAIFIGSKEIRSAVEHNDKGALSDSVLRVAALESKYNVGVAVVRRSKVAGRMQPDALVHDAVTEVYQIIEGEGVMVTGGSLQSAKPIASAAIVGEIGPSSAGQAIVGGTKHSVGPGDIVIVPAGTPHGFADITTNRIVYTIIRIDPQRVLKLHGNSH